MRMAKSTRGPFSLRALVVLPCSIWKHLHLSFWLTQILRFCIRYHLTLGKVVIDKNILTLLDLLSNTLRKGPTIIHRIWAAKELAKVSTPTSISTLKVALFEEKSFAVRAESVLALTKSASFLARSGWKMKKLNLLAQLCLRLLNEKQMILHCGEWQLL